MKASKLSTTSDPVPAMESKPTKIEDDYEAHGALETLMKASEIRRNPDLMKRVAKHGKNQKRKINSITELKERAKERRAELANGGEPVEEQD